MNTRPSTAGYAEEAAVLLERYEALDTARLHADWLNLFPAAPARILDIGSGTGRDAAWLVSLGHTVLAVEPVAPLRIGAAKLHPDPEIEWLDDTLPDLAQVQARGERFDMVMLNAVWMHLTESERETGMARVASLMATGASLFILLRHGPVPEGRRMFAVSAAETRALARANGLEQVLERAAQSLQTANHALGVSWTRLVFRKV